MFAQPLLWCRSQEQVEAARKDIDQAKDEVVFKLPEDEDENYLIEEGSSKKSKKAKGSNRLASERTGTRMSERLRSTRLLPRDGSGGEVEPPQARIPSLRHPRSTGANEEDAGLPQVAQHTRGAAVRRELGREDKPQAFLNPRRTVARREEPWTKGPSAGERGQKTAPHRTEASHAGDRVLRTNPQRAEVPSAGEKLPQALPQKPDPGASGDRMVRSSPPKPEAQLASDRLRPSSRPTADSGLDKVPRGGPQKPEKLPGLPPLQSSSPRGEALACHLQLPPFHAEALDGKALKLTEAGTVSQEQEEAPQLSPAAPELQSAKNAPSVQVPAFPAQDGLMIAQLSDTETPPDAGKALAGIPAPREKVPNPGPLVPTPELPCGSKPEGGCEAGVPLSEQKEAPPKPGDKVETKVGYDATERELANSSDEARGHEATREMTPLAHLDKVAKEAVPCKSSEDLLPQAPGGGASTSDRKNPQTEAPILASLELSTAPTSSLLQPDSLASAKEQNGLEQPPKTGDLPCPVLDLLEEVSPLQMPLPTPEATSSKANSLGESPKRGQGLVGRKLPADDQPNEESKTSATCPGTDAAHECSPGAPNFPGAFFSDESLSPIKAPRRRTSADVQIRQSCPEQDGPAAKVLRKLPGRLVTVVEEKELIRRRRNRLRKLDAADGTTVSPGNSSAQSVSEPETSPSGKELPLLRDLPARRRIELESRAAAKEKDEGSRGEGPSSPSVEPVKRKRGRPPKNKSPEQQGQGCFRSHPEPAAALASSLPSKTPAQKSPETPSHSKKASEEKVAKAQPQSKSSERKVPKSQAHRKSSEPKPPKTSTPKNKPPKAKAERSAKVSPAEKRRRGRPPKVRESPVTSTKPAAEMPDVSATRPPTAKLSPEGQMSPAAPRPAEVAASEAHESLEANPKTTPASKTSSKAQNRAPTPPTSRPPSKLAPKAQELWDVAPKLLSKPSTETGKLPGTPPRTVSATETSPEGNEPSSPPSVPPSPPKAFATADSPPKRKRGRPPKNSPSPGAEAATALPASASEREAPRGKKSPVPPVRKRRRRRRKEDLGPPLPAAGQSSSEGEDSRPLTRLALLKREEKPDCCPEGSARACPKDAVAEGLSSAESSAWEQQSGDTPTRSTRLRPGSLVPPLEWETQRRKRRCSVEGSQVSTSSKSPAPQPGLEPEGGESESSFRSSSESNSSKGAQRPKRQRCEAEGRGRGRQRPIDAADRILRSAAKPAEDPGLGSSPPAPTRKAGPAAAAAPAAPGGAPGLPSPSTAPSPAAPVTSSLSNRGRKPKT